MLIDTAVYIMNGFGLSQRRASTLVGLGRNTLGYECQPDRDDDLRKRMRELAEQRKRFGCRTKRSIDPQDELRIRKTTGCLIQGPLLQMLRPKRDQSIDCPGPF